MSLPNHSQQSNLSIKTPEKTPKAVGINERTFSIGLVEIIIPIRGRNAE